MIFMPAPSVRPTVPVLFRQGVVMPPDSSPPHHNPPPPLLAAKIKEEKGEEKVPKFGVGGSSFLPRLFAVSSRKKFLHRTEILSLFALPRFWRLGTPVLSSLIPDSP